MRFSSIDARRCSHFNPRSLHGERHESVAKRNVRHPISIHAPCTGSDTFPARPTSRPATFQSTLPARGATTFVLRGERSALISIHAPCTGSDIRALSDIPEHDVFQSTLPARGATTNGLETFGHSSFQSTLPARGATFLHVAEKQQILISIHAPCTGSDQISSSGRGAPKPFQSTLPARGATKFEAHYHVTSVISIHAPCTGSDPTDANTGFLSRYFNPRSLHGERLGNGVELENDAIFQSTLPARGATETLTRIAEVYPISTHAPRTGSDFIPTLHTPAIKISTHAPRTGSDHV